MFIPHVDERLVLEMTVVRGRTYSLDRAATRYREHLALIEMTSGGRANGPDRAVTAIECWTA
jgi:hypothetical protein